MITFCLRVGINKLSHKKGAALRMISFQLLENRLGGKHHNGIENSEVVVGLWSDY
jgi:hypothetical protein